ncbi:MAG: insulinase family protein [Euryarchaeota archaeon]|nr:insulinase family protein [Euryarchaeota archaeon]
MMQPLRLALANGAVLLLHKDHTNPSIAFRGSVRAGSAYGAPGVAEFTARLLPRGTRRRTSAQVADAIENIGAALSVANAEENVAVYGRCTRETLKTTLGILVESLTEPSLPQAELEKVRGEVLSDIRAQQDDTRRAATRRLFELVYSRDHPYGRDPKGDERSVGRVDRKAVRAFHDAQYGAAGMVFGFSGDLDAETFRSTVAKIFESIDAGAPPKPLPPPKREKRASAVVPMPHKSQADFVAGRVAVPRNHPDYYALHLANLLFGRIGLYGRLGQTVRDTLGLAYYSFSSLEARLAGGHWFLNAGVNPRNLAKAVEAIRAEMGRLEREPFTDTEIEDGKTHLVGALQVTLERNPEYAAALHDIEYYGLGVDYLERFPSIVRGVDPDAVRKMAIAYFDPDACSWVASGPVKNVKIAF